MKIGHLPEFADTCLYINNKPVSVVHATEEISRLKTVISQNLKNCTHALTSDIHLLTPRKLYRNAHHGISVSRTFNDTLQKSNNFLHQTFKKTHPRNLATRPRPPHRRQQPHDTQTINKIAPFKVDLVRTRFYRDGCEVGGWDPRGNGRK